MRKFHLDEHVPTAVSTALRRHGVDVSTSADANLLNADDIDQITYALREARVIVTHDHDFIRLHAAQAAHSGIASCHQNKDSIGELLSLLRLLDACYTTDDMVGRVEYL